MRFLFLSLLFFCFTYLSKAQNRYSLGLNWGQGFTVPSSHSNYSMGGLNRSLRANNYIETGVQGQYILGDKFGIEAALKFSYQTYLEKEGVPFSLNNYFYTDYSFQASDAHVPIQFLYKLNHPRNPFKHFTLIAGPVLHWMQVDYMQFHSINQVKTEFLTSLVGSIRMGGEPRSYGRVEYGFEYQYSLGGDYQLHISNPSESNSDLEFTSKISLLSFNFYYFFINQSLKVE